LIIAIFEISESAYLADLTTKHERGKDMGKYWAFLGIAEASAIIIGGFLVGRFGFKTIFYVVSIMFIISTTVMLKLNQKIFSQKNG
jgi:MFS family permease